MTAPIRVSVVVPVYNAGPHIEALIESLAAQTMPQSEFEVIFSDDGSTDESPQRLDRLAAERANVVVLHEPNSGWPGRPRNLGTDIAQGKYVFYVDQDDWLGVEALERMCSFAEQCDSDVLLGRYAGHHRSVAKAPFRRNRPVATLADTPLMDSLTPHKMFRTAFLREHNLRFPEGRRRLEDHVFVTEAYFLARRISVLADYHCYFHVRREDSGNAGYQRIDPAGYYGNVREVVDLVLKYTEPGTVRDSSLRRTLRVECLARLDGKNFLNEEPEFQQSLFDEARGIAELMPLSVDAGLSAPQRVRAALLRAGRLDDLITCVALAGNVQAEAQLLDAYWSSEGLMVDVAGALVDTRTHLPWRYDLTDGAVSLSAPPVLHGPYPQDAAECRNALHTASLEVVVRRRADSEEWPVPTESTVTIDQDADHTWASLRGRACIDPATLGGGSALTAGIWDVYARISQTGWTKDVRLGSHRSNVATQNTKARVGASMAVVPYWTKPYGNLSIDVGADLPRTLRTAVVATKAKTTIAEGKPVLHLTIPLVVKDSFNPATQVSLVNSKRTVVLETHAGRSTDGELTFDAALDGVDPGDWDITVRVGEDQPIVVTTIVRVSETDGALVTARAKPVAAPAVSKPPGRASAPPTWTWRVRSKLARIVGPK